MNRSIDMIRNIFPRHLHERIFLVGGAVRDSLLGQESTDIDLAAALSHDEFTALGFRLVTGRSTAAIWFRHEDMTGSIEVTPIRDIHALTDDLLRRDFCCNALAMTLSGEVIDPLGGSSDLEQRLLRACTSSTFIDDPLRIFRALRFLADDWNLSPDTEELVRRHDWTSALEAVPVERFSREMLKALGKRSPERFFQSMLTYAAGRDFLPEIFRMPSIPAGPLLHHPEGDLFTHSIQVLQRVTATSHDPLTRFCALFHDIGKLVTPPALYPRHHGHDQAGFGVAPEFCRRLRLPAQYGTALAWVSRLHGTFNLWEQLRAATKLKVAGQAIKAGIAQILPLVAAADKAGGTEPDEWRRVIGIAGMSASELGIDLEHLERMAPQKRADFILQARLQIFRMDQG